MAWRLLSGLAMVGAVVALAGCGVTPPAGGLDRAEAVSVAGGTCDVGWWLSPLVDDVPNRAERVAEEALEAARVSPTQWDEWYALLSDDADNANVSDRRLRGAAYLEAIREDVRTALDDAGYPDINRVIEINSSLDCSA